MTFELPAQTAIYNRLNGAISATIYDDVPIQPDGQPNANWPYVVVGDTTAAPWDTDDRTGASMTVTLHIWSRYAGMSEAKSIAGQIYDRLHRHALAVTGMHTVDCLYEFSTFMRDSDGETRHGVVRYRLTMQDA